MTAARFRPCVAADLAALQAIRKAAFAPVFRSFRAIVGPAIAAVAFDAADAEQAALLDRLAAAGPGQEILVAEVEGRPVGFIAFSLDLPKRMGEIGLNAVHPDHAGGGIGAAMYRHVLDRMRAAGMTVATVGTGGDPSHAPARRAYAKAGFGPAIPSLTLYRQL